MSIASEISRLQTAKSDIKTAIEAKGVTVPSSATIDTYDDYVSQISGGLSRTTSGTPYCTGHDLYVDVTTDISIDGGISWVESGVTTLLVESGSSQCTRLPAGYTELEYIRQNSNYDAYINTGVYLFDNTTNSYTVTTKLTSVFHSNLGCATIISAEVPASPYYGMGYRYNCSSTVDQLEFFGGASNYTSSVVDNGDGTGTVTFQSTGNTSWTSNAPLSLLCSFSDTSFTTPFRYADATIYSATIVKNGIAVRDLVPAKRDSDDKYGLYDVITDTFYTSPNGNNFIGGNPV
jgi:hypothetical protein